MKQIVDKTEKTASQMAKVWAHLQKRKTITNWEAISKYQITYLTHYIYELRKAGHRISKTWHKSKSGSRYAIFRLEE